MAIPANSTTLNIVLPVGISFYTFQTMSYSLDVYFGKMPPEKKILNFAVFVSFFPQLVAGPIVRASTFLPQLKQARTFDLVKIRYLLLLFLIGYIKKACISDNIAPFVDSFFATPEDYTALSAWIGVLLYTIQIYCDFSGYSDMAIACAGFLGYELCLNFDFPYFSNSITEFWRRWHISLSTWLRDYLYIPLGGNRGSKLFTYRNLMLTMLLGGLWHGAGWNFVIWGGLHGIALIAHREWSKLSQNFSPLGAIFKLIAPLLTFYWVCFTWIFFRAADFTTALVIVKSFIFLDASGSEELNKFLLLFILLLTIVHYAAYRRITINWWAKTPDWMFSVLCGCIASLALFFTAPKYSSFIYFQF
ncbi:MAG: MBOAT family protein [Pleurocapsa sp.]